jgi:hypothetical protein
MIVEEEVKGEDVSSDVNPDALEAVFDDDTVLIEEEEEVLIFQSDDEDADEIDLAFAANDEGYW